MSRVILISKIGLSWSCYFVLACLLFVLFWVFWREGCWGVAILFLFLVLNLIRPLLSALSSFTKINEKCNQVQEIPLHKRFDRTHEIPNLVPSGKDSLMWFSKFSEVFLIQIAYLFLCQCWPFLFFRKSIHLQISYLRLSYI